MDTSPTTNSTTQSDGAVVFTRPRKTMKDLEAELEEMKVLLTQLKTELKEAE